MRCTLVGDADDDAALFASPAGFGSYLQFPVSDANEMDESSASLKHNGISRSEERRVGKEC